MSMEFWRKGRASHFGPIQLTLSPKNTKVNQNPTFSQSNRRKPFPFSFCSQTQITQLKDSKIQDIHIGIIHWTDENPDYIKQQTARFDSKRFWHEAKQISRATERFRERINLTGIEQIAAVKPLKWPLQERERESSENRVLWVFVGVRGPGSKSRTGTAAFWYKLPAAEYDQTAHVWNLIGG